MTTIEAALGSLSPSRSRLDRDRLMFQAGRAAPRPSPIARWAWPAVAACFAVAAIGEAALLAVRPEPEPRVIERLVYLPSPPPPDRPAEDPEPDRVASAPERPDPVVILRQSPPGDRRPTVAEARWPEESSPASLRRRVLRYGLDALPEPPPLAMLAAEGDPETSGRLLRSEIQRILNPGESS